MTPQLQQAIKMLQLSRMELSGQIRRELEENPALEKDDSAQSDQSLHDAIDFYSYLDSPGTHQFLGPEVDGK